MGVQEQRKDDVVLRGVTASDSRVGQRARKGWGGCGAWWKALLKFISVRLHSVRSSSHF